MKNLFVGVCFIGLGLASIVGCGATSAEEQRSAQGHQFKSDQAADNGQYGVADQEQRAAAESHHDAVTKAIDEGKPIPPQTKRGDPPPPAPPK